MKFFGWMQNKLHRGKETRKSNKLIQETKKEEFSDWPHGLLTIGTFGKNDLPDNRERQSLEDDNQSLSQELAAEFTPEEVEKLQTELVNLLSRKPASKVAGEIANLPLDRFLNCPSSLEVDRRLSSTLCRDLIDKEEEDEEDIDRTIQVILGRCRDACKESNKKSIGKKSVSFLLKKMFVCRSGFAPTPSLRDTLPESRMEKLLRTMLSKKIYHQNSSRASSMKKYIEDVQMPSMRKQDEIEDKSNDQKSKWVKTDSEYIVLEI
ncbi:Protein DEEPER ROOTING 1 [Heracleum sosnowskyi]|uniref:Protein DEEPER ROOTING 1 n=1 Tax=Heracleum sosnowskyi TaxID=360622 RepID=A0AAD8H2W4_9APIA|nr:Protein DEEPER ROOTING 1 [Heracleum sosnowskyi]